MRILRYEDTDTSIIILLYHFKNSIKIKWDSLSSRRIYISYFTYVYLCMYIYTHIHTYMYLYTNTYTITYTIRFGPSILHVDSSKISSLINKTETCSFSIFIHAYCEPGLSQRTYVHLILPTTFEIVIYYPHFKIKELRHYEVQ